ncbi:MAG: 3-dehydroquinate synthase, partial [Thermodesulfovibrionales bacterium]
KRFGFSKRVAIISNPTVFGLYGKAVIDSLRSSDFETLEVIIPDGEEYKDYLWSYYILTELLRQKLDRKSCLIALGGGVIGDITGFVASIYMRGINFVQVPTTLLSQVDSSVGGKTGVNHHLGKNMIGTFYQPRLVWIDIDTLKTLQEREFLSGLSEVIKYGVIWDRDFFDFLDRERESILALDPLSLSHIVRRSCEIKAEVVSKDEREAGLRAILNFGHTVGHAIETVTGYRMYLHGEAVSIGMRAEAKLSMLLGISREGVEEQALSILSSYRLPVNIPVQIKDDEIISTMEIDKKSQSGKLRFILPERIGKVRIEEVTELEKIREAIRGCKA